MSQKPKGRPEIRKTGAGRQPQQPADDEYEEYEEYEEYQEEPRLTVK